ncbi:peptidase S15 [Shewanella woodyi ATCC 51908]|uniref:Peptidase S15 n=2 Tax=Shewanella woodyi TaxID=60961 RepID=B1KDJ2_SHEWM|nr:peptidase S15 [Shewanella woodyi ATCC 51908]
MNKTKISILATVLASVMSTPFSVSAEESFNTGKNAVNFLSENVRISGNLYLPDNYSANGSFPAIVVITPASGVKEQTAGIYAKKLADKGYVTLAFDHRSYGESGGMPRGMENAPMKVEDIKNAISFIRTVAGVDIERIGELGLCSGAGYSLQTAQMDGRIDSVATVSGFVDFIDYGLSGATQYQNGLSGDKIEQFQTQIQWASEARQRYFETGEVMYVDGIPPKSERLGIFWDRAADYYLNPERGGAVATYSPMRAAMSLDTRYFFNPTEHMELMRGKPFLAIVGTEALSAQFSEVAVERSKKAGGEAELFKVKGAQHFDLYDKHKYVNQAVDKLDSFYRTTLKR